MHSTISVIAESQSHCALGFLEMSQVVELKLANEFQAGSTLYLSHFFSYIFSISPVANNPPISQGSILILGYWNKLLNKNKEN